MRQVLFLLLISLLLATCDDGDIITVELEFDKELSLCDNNTENYLVYDTRTDPNESLSLLFPRSGNETIFNPEVSPAVRELTINETSTLFNYRSYNIEPTFCESIPDPDLIILEDNMANGGLVIVTSVFIDSDDDGISNEDEGFVVTADGDVSGSLDSDGDGIYDYIDQDDDNDNVPTRFEDHDADGDNNPFTNPLDTDNDGTPDYLDTDDDEDGIPTRLEDENEDENPRNDFQESTDGSIVPARYLDANAAESFPDSGFINNSYTRSVTVSFFIDQLGLDIASFQTLDFGTYTKPTETITQTID
ncbi:hypothetical protein [Winogradskyella sp. A3E31]|uniref:hypothetical protein n=1 Tax=Winogradskyella sp. A3E31 TaxID=3349637 RepID=UPI00398AF575